MIVTRNNIEKVKEKELDLLNALLTDIEEFNTKFPIKIELHWQDWHDDEFDYYGTYKLFGNDDSLTLEMDIHELDSVLCAYNGLVRTYQQFIIKDRIDYVDI